MADTCEKCGQPIAEPVSDNETTAFGAGCIYFIAVYAVAILKAIGVINWSWWWIPFAPLIFAVALFGIVFASTFLFWKENPHA